MKFIKLEKVKDGTYLKNYELTYLNKLGKEKKYEIVSRKELDNVAELGQHSSGVSIVVTKGEQLLLLKEFRMGVNRFVYNLAAGMLEENETVEECIRRELYEETGLHAEKIHTILRPSYAAVAIADTMTQMAFVEADGELSDHTSPNEMIEARFYSKEEIKELLETEAFSSRCQLAAYQFAYGGYFGFTK